MAMSPEEITGKQFQTRFRGLDPAGVTAHLDLLAAEFSAMGERGQATGSGSAWRSRRGS